tara:strand:+ start:4164 stop:4913 length:750 start_codon:yes stop_codon:yes gene_type:complete
MHKDTLITGANGMLGSVLSKKFKNATLLKGRKDIDLTNTEDISSFFKNKRFKQIIHCAAFTNLNYCEENPIDSFFLHSGIIPLLRSKCDKLVYISTNPSLSEKVYYKSKRKGEFLTTNRKGDLVVRVNIYGNGGLCKWALNALKKKEMIHGYYNVYFNPVSVYQLSKFLSKKSHKYEGVVNVGADKKISKFNFLKTLAEKSGLDERLITPFEVIGDRSDLDLTVPLKNKYIKCSLKRGINHYVKNILHS